MEVNSHRYSRGCGRKLVLRIAYRTLECSECRPAGNLIRSYDGIFPLDLVRSRIGQCLPRRASTQS